VGFGGWGVGLGLGLVCYNSTLEEDRYLGLQQRSLASIQISRESRSVTFHTATISAESRNLSTAS
jgi:hypothetical protein